MQTVIKWVPTHVKHLTDIISFNPPASQVSLILSLFYRKGPIERKWLEPRLSHKAV